MGELEELRATVTRLQRENTRLRQDTRQLWARREHLWDQVERVSSMGTWIWDMATNQVDWSEKLCDILGYPPDTRPEAVQFDAHVHPEDLAVYREGRNRAMRGETSEPVRFRFIRPDGRTVHLLQVASPVLGENGNVTAFVGSIMDVTHFETTQQERVRAGRLEAVGRLASRVAHDFNNILSVIGGNTELMLMERPDEQALLRIMAVTDAGASLTRQLLALGRLPSSQLAVVDASTAARETASMIRRLLRDDIALRLDLSPAQCPLRLDPGQLQSALVNLVLNARDAMPDGGTITLATALTAEDTVTVSVRDTGTGIDPEAQALIFEPFFTTKPSGKGTGLGLASVQGFVQQAGGELHLESAQGVGSTFSMQFPRAKAPPAEADEHAEAPLTGSVLLVEDDPGIRELIPRMLSETGCAVHVASNPIQALALWPLLNALPRVLLTDIVMPGTSGRELAARIRASEPDLRVLYITGYEPDVPDDDPAPVLTKPFTRKELLRVLRGLMGA